MIGIISVQQSNDLGARCLKRACPHVARAEYHCQEAVPSATSSYADPRAHALRDRYLRVWGGEEIPVPVESITEDLLGLRIEERLLEWSGMLLPAERTIVG